MASSEVEIARRQIEFARGYTLTLLDGIDDDQWFKIPTGGSSHLAWQVGHLAMAEYGLCMFRQRGRRTEDLELMSGKFRKRFSKGTTPEGDANIYPPYTEILDVFHKIHERALEEIAGYRDEDLTDEIDQPYAVHPNKLGALFFCASHEMLHAGQIGMLRRLLGMPPVR